MTQMIPFVIKMFQILSLLPYTFTRALAYRRKLAYTLDERPCHIITRRMACMEDVNILGLLVVVLPTNMELTVRGISHRPRAHYTYQVISGLKQVWKT